VTPLAKLQQQLVAAEPRSVDGNRISIAAAQVSSSGDDVDVELTLRGDVCGALAFKATPEFDEGGTSVVLARPRLRPGERERAEQSSLDGEAIARSLATTGRVMPLLSAHGLRTAAPAVVAAVSPPNLALTASIASARGAGAMVRSDEIVAFIEATGALSVATR